MYLTFIGNEFCATGIWNIPDKAQSCKLYHVTTLLALEKRNSLANYSHIRLIHCPFTNEAHNS